VKLITVEIFRTNIQNKRIGNKVLKKLNTLFPESRINFDLEDCDKILRIEGGDFTETKVKEVLMEFGYECELLE
jgi:hypothetical protein